MPFYDLYCAECEKEFNILASITAKVEKHVPCPECGSFDLKTVYKDAPAYIRSRGGDMPGCPSRANRNACSTCPHAN